MTTITYRLLTPALLCLCAFLHRSIAFQRPSAVRVASRRIPAESRRNGVGILAVKRDNDDTNDVREGADRVSRRDALGRAMAMGAGLAANINAERANALDSSLAPTPTLLLASSGEGDPNKTTGAVKGMPSPGKKLGGLTSKIRSVSRIMDELQRDLMQERWDLVEAYPMQIRSYVPVFTAYTDSAFPTEASTDKGLRVALRYEVGRLFASLERFRKAVDRRSLDEAYVAYSDMSLHFDRYLRVGGLYTFYDDTVSLEAYYEGLPDASLVYADPAKDPALARDLVVLIKGPDKGRTGIMIGMYRDGSGNCAVKLDKKKGVREIRVVPCEWAAKRVGEQDPDDVFLIPRG